MRICFFGTPNFASFSLNLAVKHGYTIVCVVTAPDKPKGRGLKLEQSDVKKTAIELGIPVLQPTNLKSVEFEEELASYKIDLGLIIAFRMLPEKIWSMPKLGTFNLHASLLPNYRGAAPINHAIINGESKTGVTTFFLKHEIDTGEIIGKKEISILPNETVGELYAKLMELGGELVLESLALIEKGEFTLSPQLLTGSEKLAPKIFRADCEIKPNLLVEKAYNLWRGLHPWPGSWCNSSKLGECKFVQISKSKNIVLGNDFEVQNGKLYWPCIDGSLEIIELRIPGKSTQNTKDVINGYFK